MPKPGVSSISDPRPLVVPLKQIPIKFSPFDQHHYQRLIRAREEAIRNMLPRLIPVLGLKTAVRCGSRGRFLFANSCGMRAKSYPLTAGVSSGARLYWDVAGSAAPPYTNPSTTATSRDRNFMNAPPNQIEPAVGNERLGPR
jgi:hypothetical protein